MPKGAKHAQADECIAPPAGRIQILRHSHDDRLDQGPDRTDRFQGIGSARLHERPAGVAGHDLLHIPAQWIKAHTLALGKTGKVLWSGQADLVTCLLEPPGQGDTRLDIPA